MKTLFSLGGIMAVLGLAVASTFAQTQNSTSSSATYIQTSKVIGKPVKSSQGEQIGTVKDVVLDRNGCIAYTVLSTGGGRARVSGGGKMVAVPWTVYSPAPDLSELTVTVDRERIYNAPVFDYARIEEYSKPDYINNVYSYYGVSAGAGVGVGVSGGTSTTTTGAATTTTTGAATGAGAQAGAAAGQTGAASPAQSPMGAAGQGSPSPNATEGRRAHPGAAAAAGAAAVRARETATPSPYGRAGTSPSQERTPSAKQKQEQTTPPSGRSETGTRSEGGQATSQESTTGEKATGSQRREKGKRGTASPSEKPPGDE
jgi:sporulation protein YlmC with PRC-barrel domain